ncbi:hypothetical protein [Streptomyces sp. NPDC058548]|uniref:hypothetical protein n=1 Tax=Streptomyces sp. NPDC058548 TaxID=3346545 RepID=UPI003653EBF9
MGAPRKAIMSVLKRSTALLAATAAVVGTAVVTASPAAALSYKCSTSTKSIDDPRMYGPWADNWDITVSVCSARSGSTAYTYAKVSWDGPVYAEIDDTAIFDDAYLRVSISKSVAGTDPMVKKVYFSSNFESRLENSDGWGNYNNSFTSSVISYPVGSTRSYGGAQLALDWDNDGRSYQYHPYTPSPLV